MLSDELRELYEETVLDHNRAPSNFRALPDADHSADGYNPLCGDRVTVFVKLDGDVVTDVTFQGTGCAISITSASLMTEAVKGRTTAQVEALFDHFHHLVTSPPDTARADEDLGDLSALAGVREFPVRVKCATLAWHALRAALHDQQTVTTE